MKRPCLVVLKETEKIDGVKWRRLPKVVEPDGKGGYWIPEDRVEWMEDEK